MFYSSLDSGDWFHRRATSLRPAAVLKMKTERERQLSVYSLHFTLLEMSGVDLDQKSHEDTNLGHSGQVTELPPGMLIPKVGCSAQEVDVQSHDHGDYSCRLFYGNGLILQSRTLNNLQSLKLYFSLEKMYTFIATLSSQDRRYTHLSRQTLFT